MARLINKLSPRTVSTITKPGYHGDGGNLYLQVGPTGAKSWVFRYMLEGKARGMGLGPVHTITLAEARVKATEARKMLLDGIDPLAARDQAKVAKKVKAMRGRTFRQVAEAVIESKVAEWKGDASRVQWEQSLASFVYPTIGEIPVADVDVGMVLEVLRPIWAKKTETANRVRNRIEAILDAARAEGFRTGENPARWKGHLDKLLPKKEKIAKKENYEALPYDKAGDFMVALRGRDTVQARALEFAVLTAARSGEVIGATWDEIDLDAKVWTIPADRMKADREHRVPLSDAAVSILEAMKPLRGESNWLFPGSRGNQCLGPDALRQALQRVGYGDACTVHGFRSTFRDWVAERTAFPRELAEKALAHTIAVGSEAAYQRGDLLDKRRKLMDAWAEFCTKPSSQGGNVTNIRRA